MCKTRMNQAYFHTMQYIDPLPPQFFFFSRLRILHSCSVADTMLMVSGQYWSNSLYLGFHITISDASSEIPSSGP